MAADETGVKLHAVVDHWRPMNEIRLIVNGRTVQTWYNPDRRTHWEIDQDIPVEKSAWIALHVRSDSTGTVDDTDILLQAHTAPVYIIKDGKPIRDAAGIQTLIDQAATCRETYASSDWQYVDPRIRDQLITRCDEALAEYRKRLAEVQ